MCSIATQSFWVYDQNPAQHQQPYVVKLVNFVALSGNSPLSSAMPFLAVCCSAVLCPVTPSFQVHDQNLLTISSPSR
jgi:hypothetical protein